MKIKFKNILSALLIAATAKNAAMVTAIKKFQEDAGLEVDGYAGAFTIKALKN
jgi:murein L,D-transpeptidase YcbB/YkuD